MATRADIRDAFTSELQAIAGTYDVTDENGNVIGSVTLDATDIGLRHPEASESRPQVVYHENYRRRTFNDVGRGPDMVEYDASGNVDREIWREYIEAQFIIDVRASNEISKEPLYEALRTQFARYQFPPWDETSLHGDILEIGVQDSITVDTGDEEDVIRGDQIEVHILFHRDYERVSGTDVSLITSVDHLVDADNDGTTDFTLVTS